MILDTLRAAATRLQTTEQALTHWLDGRTPVTAVGCWAFDRNRLTHLAWTGYGERVIVEYAHAPGGAWNVYVEPTGAPDPTRALLDYQLDRRTALDVAERYMSSVARRNYPVSPAFEAATSRSNATVEPSPDWLHGGDP